MLGKPDEDDDAVVRIVDYSDPAQEPHDAPRPYRRNDTGGFVAAGIAVAMLIVGGVAYVGYLAEGNSSQTSVYHKSDIAMTADKTALPKASSP